MSTEQPVLIGVIGGSGLYHLDNFTFVKEVNLETPWGYPSSPITIASLPTGARVAFVARHGPGHAISPSDVPSRANIAALKHLGVKAIVAFSAVGSLREEIKPGDFVIPSQIIDRTKGVRAASFFDGSGVVAHGMFGDPFDNKLLDLVKPLVKDALNGEVGLHTGKTVVCMEGPQFSTRAESLMYRQWGGDIINMSVLPEAKLAREAEIAYALIATSTDYDAWRVDHEAVTVAEVFKTLQNNAETSRRVAAHVLEDVLASVIKGDVIQNAVGSMQYSIVTAPHKQSKESRKKLSYILPYFE